MTSRPSARTSEPLPRKRKASRSGATKPIAPDRQSTATATAIVEEAHRRRRGQLDLTDLKLIDLLTTDGRTSNRALATAVGLAETTVASRIQAMFDRHMVGVTALIDWRAAGYGVDMWLQVTVERGVIKDVGADIGRLEGVLGVYVTSGFSDLVVHVVAGTTTTPSGSWPRTSRRSVASPTCESASASRASSTRSGMARLPPNARASRSPIPPPQSMTSTSRSSRH